MTECKYSKQYQGIRKSKRANCCELCKAKYQIQQIAVVLDRVLFDLKGKDSEYAIWLWNRLRDHTFYAERKVLK
jgi:hypothetical protein